MSAHVVDQERAGGRRRWVCLSCDWATPWDYYTTPTRAAAAVRHAADLQRSEYAR